MEKVKIQLIQTGYNIQRLYEDRKIDDEAYKILSNRNTEAITLIKNSIKQVVIDTYKAASPMMQSNEQTNDDAEKYYKKITNNKD